MHLMLLLILCLVLGCHALEHSPPCSGGESQISVQSTTEGDPVTRRPVPASQLMRALMLSSYPRQRPDVVGRVISSAFKRFFPHPDTLRSRYKRNTDSRNLKNTSSIESTINIMSLSREKRSGGLDIIFKNIFRKPSHNWNDPSPPGTLPPSVLVSPILPMTTEETSSEVPSIRQEQQDDEISQTDRTDGKTHALDSSSATLLSNPAVLDNNRAQDKNGTSSEGATKSLTVGFILTAQVILLVT